MFVITIPSQKNKKTSTIMCPRDLSSGHYFFIVFMNDISNASKLLYTILFADDTSVFLEETEYSKLIETVNQEVNKVTIWFYTTHLSSYI